MKIVCQAQIRSIISLPLTSLVYYPYHVLSSYRKSSAITVLQNICRTIPYQEARMENEGCQYYYTIPICFLEFKKIEKEFMGIFWGSYLYSQLLYAQWNIYGNKS